MIAAKSQNGPADDAYGYTFGVDGVVSRETAQQLLDCHHATLYRLCKKGLIRRGRLGKRARFCRRSITEYMRSLEV